MPSAGEVEQFVYCAHNWALARQGVDPHDAASRRGQEEHERIGRSLDQAARDARLRKDALKWMFRVLAVAGSATFLALELTFLAANPYHVVFLTTALVLTSSSAALLVVGLDAEARERRIRKEAGVLGDNLDMSGQGTILEDPEWGLRGSPDSLLDTPHGAVPVEVKTGHTPARPYDSHVMQLAVYLRLLEADRRAASYGLLNYPDGVFRIPWDQHTKRQLREVLQRMAHAEREGKADRDHEDPRRCMGCARREACTQKLTPRLA